MRVHFIAIGGAAMHSLAIALYQKGNLVTGSDDEIFDPARTQLSNAGLLPDSFGWFPERITPDLDAIVLGMHAHKDNPELKRALELGIRVYSYPEFLYRETADKTRVVIAGSHGKTTITSMILHVLQSAGINADYMVGAQLEGFEVMVRLTHEAKYMIIEGDEYLSSTLDPRPKFHLYKPHIALLSGIAWDHMNVFPTFENYVSQFIKFINLIQPGGSLIYCKADPEVRNISQNIRTDITAIPYGDLAYRAKDQKVVIISGNREIPILVFGKHNVQNIHGAWMVCRQMGITDETFFSAISTFKGASKRLQLLKESGNSAVYKDFAHSPSKLKATVEAVKELYPGRKLIACLELHTYSSLNKNFLPLYRHCMDSADLPIVYFSPHAVALKRLPGLSAAEVSEAFDDMRLIVYNNSEKLQEDLSRMDFHNKNLLLMSSGNFDGLDLEGLAEKLLKR